MTTTVVHYKDREEDDVYVGRPSEWGNPFRLGGHTREQAIAKHREWIMTQPHLLARLGEVRGKRLACFCSPRPCHGDTLAELADTPNLDLFY